MCPIHRSPIAMSGKEVSNAPAPLRKGMPSAVPPAPPWRSARPERSAVERPPNLLFRKPHASQSPRNEGEVSVRLQPVHPEGHVFRHVTHTHPANPHPERPPHSSIVARSTKDPPLRATILLDEVSRVKALWRSCSTQTASSNRPRSQDATLPSAQCSTRTSSTTATISRSFASTSRTIP